MSCRHTLCAKPGYLTEILDIFDFVSIWTAYLRYDIWLAFDVPVHSIGYGCPSTGGRQTFPTPFYRSTIMAWTAPRYPLSNSTLTLSPSLSRTYSAQIDFMHWLGLPHSARARVAAFFLVYLLGIPHLVLWFSYFAPSLGFVTLVYIRTLFSSATLDLIHR